MSFCSVSDEKQSFAALQHLHYRSDAPSKEALFKGKIRNMEPNYLDIEALVQQARQQRNQALGELITVAWNKCKKLLGSDPYAARPGSALWRVLPP